MSCYRRPNVTGATVFFTVALAARGGTLLIDEIGLLRGAVRKTMAERPFAVDAWVVLPDYMHVVWTLPAGDREYGPRYRLIKSRFSMGLPKGPLRQSHLARNERGVWQRRFWVHHIRDEVDYMTHIKYCWFNPVKHGFVNHAEDWPYTSINPDLPPETSFSLM